MAHDTEVILNLLTDRISSIGEVQSIGISGSKAPLPKAGEGDIDIFIYCDKIPGLETRQTVLSQFGELLQEVKINVFDGGHWGIGDFAHINGIETWLMYFTVDETLRDLDSILNGDYPDKLDNYYYPIGRCAMLKNISILYDKNSFLSSLTKRLLKYPDKLSTRLAGYHLDELEDNEDLERAVMRKDVLFYHFALDIAIDHFLQALFAINRIYFPSRKRTLELINSFDRMPERCGERLLEVVKLGGCTEGIGKSYELWCKLIDEIRGQDLRVSRK